jgi:ferredoxin
MNLNHFLPFLRRPKKDAEPRAAGFFERAARRALPPTFFSDPLKGKAGLFRRALRKIGPVTQSAPVRRAIQAVCFALFLVLFFYVCWPYTVQPDTRTTVEEMFVPAWAREGGKDALLRRLNDASDLAHMRAEIEKDFAARGRRGNAIISHYDPHPEWNGRDIREIADADKTSPADVVLAIVKNPDEQAHLWISHYADDRERKEKVPATFFLIIDPLVSISTAITAKTWEWSLTWALGILAVCLIFPRGFCGYLCPLGTLIDLFDWAIGKRVNVFKVKGDGWWVHLKYYLLVGVIVSAFCGVLLSGVVAAIPVITRGMLYIFEPLQLGFMRGWHQVPAINSGQIVSIVLFLSVLGLGLLRKRFWCRYVCPSGAVFSVFNFFRMSERKVESSCIHCNKCVEICPFDAIKADFTTRTADCTLCQSCGGVCPTHAIKFVERWDISNLKTVNEPPVSEVPLNRRGFLIGTAGSLFTVLGMRTAFGAGLDDPSRPAPIRPPGSVPEEQFLQMCIRCGECFKACPSKVLQPVGFKQGLEGLWTPELNTSFAGCETSCNNCGQVCPTGAIRAVPLVEKREARLGLAILNLQTCLPIAGKQACQLCVDECTAAGYNAIEFNRVHAEVDEQGMPIEGTGFLAPVVVHDKCVGCGLCQTRCNHINVEQEKILSAPAIVVVAGKGKRDNDAPYEDRKMNGSYRQLRKEEALKRKKQLEEQGGGKNDSYMPDFIK